MSHEVTGQSHGLCSYTEWVFTIYGDLLARVIQTNNSIYSMVSAISITTKTKLPYMENKLQRQYHRCKYRLTKKADHYTTLGVRLLHHIPGPPSYQHSTMSVDGPWTAGGRRLTVSRVCQTNYLTV